MPPARIGVLASGSGTLLDAMLREGVTIAVVVADRPCRALEIATEHGVPAELLERNPNRYLVRVYRRHAELLESEGRADEAMDLLKKAVAIGEFEQPRLRLPRRKAITHS